MADRAGKRRKGGFWHGFPRWLRKCGEGMIPSLKMNVKKENTPTAIPNLP
jgi:hypothetical protein